MTHLLAQGLFHVAYTASFFGLAAALWFQAKKSGNRIGKLLGLSFFTAGLEYTAITAAILFFSDNLRIVTVLSSAIATTLCMIAITFPVPIISYVFPRVSVKPAYALLGVLTVVMAIENIFIYQTPGLTPMGVLNVSGPKWQIMTIGILMMLIYVPIGVGFIYKTLKSKQYLKGGLLGFGLAIGTLFLPVTYQVSTFNAYIFFNILAATGFALIIAGLVVRPVPKLRRR